MSDKNFMAYGDAETIFSEYASELKKKANVFIGMQAEWDELTAEQKKRYDEAHFTDDESAVEYDSGWITDNDFVYRRVGKTVTIHITFSGGEYQTWKVLGTLPEGFRPRQYIYQMCHIGGTTDPNAFAQLAIGSTGKIEIKANLGSAVYGCATYIVD